MTTTNTRIQAENAGNVPPTLRALKRALALTDKQIAEGLGGDWTPNRVQQKMTGRSRCSADELQELAHYFGVSVELLFLEPDAAMRIAVEHYDLRIRWSVCTAEFPAYHRGTHSSRLAEACA